MVLLVGFWRELLTGRTGPVTAALAPTSQAPAFAVDADSGVLYGTPTLDDWIAQTGRIRRAEALRVPAVKRARDLICGAIGQFPLQVYDPAGKPATAYTPNLFQQPEAGVAPSVTWTRVVEDLLIDERAWFKVTMKGWHGRPIQGHKLDADTVTLVPEYRHYAEGVVKVWPEREGLIRIDSPNAGLLAGSPAVRACIALERATLAYVDGVPMLDYFTPADPTVDPFDSNEQVQEELLDPWEKARKERTTGYVPAGVKYNVAGWDPDKLQLVEAREFAITEVARLTGIDAEDLSVSTTSRTYFNGQDRRRVRVEDVLGPYMTAIEGRLSMDDVTPHGYTVGFDATAYLRLDDLAAAQTDSVLVAAKILQPDEARAKRGLEPLGQPAEDVDPQEVRAAVAASTALNQPEPHRA